jgi:hypothetical protein
VAGDCRTLAGSFLQSADRFPERAGTSHGSAGRFPSVSDTSPSLRERFPPPFASIRAFSHRITTQISKKSLGHSTTHFPQYK